MLARRLALTVLCGLAVVVGAAWGAASALAGVVHPPLGSFGPSGTGAGSFAYIETVAVDESTGDVFVYDSANQAIYKYTASGEPTEFSALKSNAITGVSAGQILAANQIAVDSSNGPAKGDIYVANLTTVNVYGADGHYLGELDGAGNPGGEWPCGVAVDPAGNLYVGFFFGYVDKYSPTSGLVHDSDYVSATNTNGFPICNLAADASGHVYATEWNRGEPAAVFKLSATEFSPFGGTSTVNGYGIDEGTNVAADPVNGDVYVDESSQVAQFDSTIKRLGVTSGVQKSEALAVNGATGELYVADGDTGRVGIFGPPEIVPDVTVEQPSELQSTSATLKGTVNPSGVQVTSCEFEYGAGSQYGQAVPCEQQPGSGSSPVTVTAKIAGLRESATYNYRLRAGNATAASSSEIAYFTTYGPPTIKQREASAITHTTATLNAQINPHGYDTTYRFEYGADAKYGTSVPVPDGDIGSGANLVSVKAQLAGLQQGVVYHYRVVASNARGQSVGEDQSFMAQPAVGILHEWTSEVGVSSAQVHAEISPRGLGTTYHFEYGVDTKYGTSVPIPDGAIGAQYGEGAVRTSEQLAGLAPHTTYHFRVSATNANGADVGADVTFTTSAAPSQPASSCPNGRVGLSVNLPDCRAYELVSPVEKGAASVATEPTYTQSSGSGDAIKYDSLSVFGSAQGVGTRGAEYVAQRDARGWTTQDIDPFQAGTPVSVFATQSYVNFSEDLTKGVYLALSPVVSGHPNNENVVNLYLRTNVLSGALGDYSLLDESSTPLPPRSYTSEAGYYDIEFAGASADYSRVLFESTYDLTPEAAGLDPNRVKVYEWENGTVRLESVLPGGSAAGEAMAGAGVGGGHRLQNLRHWPGPDISSDGSRVIFMAAPLQVLDETEGVFAGNLYMRINDRETVQLNASERSQRDPAGSQPAQFWGATADESKVFFSSPEMLTDNAEVNRAGGESGSNIYEYDVNAPSGKRLTLISVDNEPNEPGGEEPASSGTLVSGISSDGSYVYFTGGNRLVAGQPTYPEGPHLAPFESLYVWHNGTVRFITTHIQRNQTQENVAWGKGSIFKENYAFRVTPDGKTVAFMSSDQRTAERVGYDNAGETCKNTEDYGPHRCQEVYVYDYDTNKLVCASCDPNGAAPIRDASFAESADHYPIPFGVHYAPRVLSADGRYVFFDTKDPLVPQDTNGRTDVYEFDTKTEEVHLVSSGGCGCDSMFVDASADGRNVFFTTLERLVRVDVDDNVDLYDARINGGIAAQNEVAPSPCEGDDCQGPAGSPPIFSLPASSTFSGSGNPVVSAPQAKRVKAAPKKHGTKRRKTRRKRRKTRGKRRNGKRASRRGR